MGGSVILIAVQKICNAVQGSIATAEGTVLHGPLSQYAFDLHQVVGLAKESSVFGEFARFNRVASRGHDDADRRPSISATPSLAFITPTKMKDRLFQSGRSCNVRPRASCLISNSRATPRGGLAIQLGQHFVVLGDEPPRLGHVQILRSNVWVLVLTGE